MKSDAQGAPNGARRPGRSAGFFQEADGSRSMRRLLAFLFAAIAAISLLHTTFAPKSGGLPAAQLALGSMLLLLGLTTSEGIAGLFSKRNRNE